MLCFVHLLKCYHILASPSRRYLPYGAKKPLLFSLPCRLAFSVLTYCSVCLFILLFADFRQSFQIRKINPRFIFIQTTVLHLGKKNGKLLSRTDEWIVNNT